MNARQLDLPNWDPQERAALGAFAGDVCADPSEVVRQIVVERLEDDGYLPRPRGGETRPEAGKDLWGADLDEAAIMDLLHVISLDGGAAILARLAGAAEGEAQAEATATAGGNDHGY